MPVKFTNNASATLASSINSSVTSISLSTGQGALFPSLGAGEFFYATLVDSSNNLEIVQVTARSTDSLTVVRGQDGTSARSYSAGDKLELRPVAAAWNTMVQTDNTQTISGNKTFSGTCTFNNTITGSVSGNAGTVTDGVYLNTSQTISGTKTFSAAQIFNNDINLQWKDSGGTTRSVVRLNSSNNLLIMNAGNGSVLVRNQGDSSTLVTLTDNSGNFTATGNVTAYSDERLKSNIRTIDGALQAVKHLRGVSFSKDGKAGIGVIAQEVKEIFPEVVLVGEDGYLSVAYGNLVGVLIEAVKELSAKVEALEAK